ncbi:hypothetical protein CORC01_01670 [Colletotrichum orchidophilum]|uniref:Nephrocystin 3-like N-terminal domain-containing protein n=1 Tax=Colletotrichum orchidophilum TaxID=1209926 RepID=A0A1G4BN68_9PEZI|nr:uncharacterized protein CORC01_01670 [Colletotrichum orchidophilum]OHF02912.1 hypothetical protein CORC01_01670 [Colletotrichum orchidophilum]
MAEDLQRRCARLQADTAIKTDAGMNRLIQRCIETSKELVDEVSGLAIATDDKHLRWVKIKLSFKAYWKESKINDIQERLGKIKTEIFGTLQALLYQHRLELSDHVRSLGDASSVWNRTTDARLDRMSKDIGKLVESTSEAASGKELESFATMLARFVEEAKHQGNIRQILKSLRFAQIIERQTEIPKAHQNTFEWVFQENNDVNFSSWLQGSTGIFWVTGKPGSGKSTLMKFISGHEKTLQLAKAWAAPQQLIITVQCPEMISDVFPERYTSPTYVLDSWTIETLLVAFERLRSIPSLSKRILMFVDGLDEYKGDHKDVVKFLDNMSQSSDIKICCASRPWPVFESAFGNSLTRIQMDRLTAKDMATYVSDILGQHEHYQCLLETDEAEAIKLIESISQKSEGVFFWVALVVKSLARGLDNWDDIGILHERVSEFPSDLDEFFQRMLDSIEDVYTETASRTFSMLLMADMPVPVIFSKIPKKLFTVAIETILTTRKPGFGIKVRY